MRAHRLPAWGAAVLLAACAAQAADPPLPAWLAARVAGHARAPLANPPREVWQGQYQGRRVYYEPPVCCDLPSNLFDEQGALLCQPGGGFIGGGDGRCPDADPGQLRQRRLWLDPRAPR